MNAEALRVYGSVGRVFVFGTDMVGLKKVAEGFRADVTGFKRLRGSQMLGCRDEVAKKVYEWLLSDNGLLRLYGGATILYRYKGNDWDGALTQPGPFSDEEIVAGYGLLLHGMDSLVEMIEKKSDLMEQMGLLHQLIMGMTYDAVETMRIIHGDKGVV
jgi:hypothetical protein